MRGRLVSIGAAVCGVVFLLAANASAQGHFEFGAHYGTWSVNVLKSLANDFASDATDELVDKQVERIQQTFPTLAKLSSTNHADFTSSGNNVGFEFRWYPRGENGSFSLGVAGERTTMRLGIPNAATNVQLRETRTGAPFTFDATGEATVEAKPFAVMGSLRWDILPSRRFTPYVSLGFGAAGVSAIDSITYHYAYSGVLSTTVPGTPTVQIADDQQKTLAQLKVEENKDYPIQFFPFIQVNVGFKAKVTKQIHLLVDYGLLDGMSLRAGIAVRL